MRQDTFNTIKYKDHFIHSYFLDNVEQFKVIFAIVPSERYKTVYFNSLLGAKRAITKHVKKEKEKIHVVFWYKIYLSEPNTVLFFHTSDGRTGCNPVNSKATIERDNVLKSLGLNDTNCTIEILN